MPSLLDIEERQRFDFQVLHDMVDERFSFQAYASRPDLDSQRHPVTEPRRAVKYRWVLHVPTLSGPGTFSASTVIGVDTEVTDYPLGEPRVWLLSTPAPWSPHFQREPGTPVCTGSEFWVPRRGHVTLGHLVIHLQRLLNWDEKGRGDGYVGWNPDAVAWHRQHYGARPLDATLRYSKLPPWLNAHPAAAPKFQVLARPGGNRHFQRLG